ncbi:MAG: tetratricopeptide repeat protein [Candidatus Latescibacteria bacterium]|nr:tetratricopeptide repeat protein [Candidatus Latescibacterota bacterium]
MRKPVLWVILVPVLVYANALGNGFTFDDHAIVEDNPSVLTLDVVHIFSVPYWPNREHAGLYRPLTTLSLALNYAIHTFDPFGYHFFNVLLHVLNTLLVYMLTKHLLRVPMGLFVALLFALHPVQTEAVNGIVGRSELLSAFWVLVACLLYVRSGVNVGRGLNRLYGLSLVASFLAMCSKENAACMVGLVVIYDWMWIHRGRWPQGVAGFLKRGVPRYMPYVGLVVLFLFIRTQVVGAVFLPTPPAEFDNPLPYLDGLSRWLTTAAALGVYFRLLVFPWRLMPDYSYGEISAVTSVFDFSVLIPLVVMVALGSVVMVGFVRRQLLAGALGILFFAVAFVPVSNFIVIIGTILGERLLYLPMVGVALFGGVVASRLSVGEKRGYVIMGLGVILLVLGVRTGVRNADWKNDVTLFMAAIHDGNRSAKVYYNLGVGYRKQGLYQESVKAFEKLADLKADDADSWRYLGIVYAEQKLYAKAAEAYEKAVVLNETRVDVWKRLGDMYVHIGNWSGAEKAFERVVRVHQDDVGARFELAKACYYLEKMACAIKQCEVLLSEYAFDHQLATLLLGELYLKTGRLADAQILIQAAYVRWPEDGRVKNLIANLQELEIRN